MRLFLILLSLAFIFTSICVANAQKFDSPYSPRYLDGKFDRSYQNNYFSGKTKEYEYCPLRYLGVGEVVSIFGGNIIIIYGDQNVGNNSGFSRSRNEGYSRGNDNRNFNRNNMRNNRKF